MSSELDKAANERSAKVTKALWVDGKIVTNNQSFKEGALWLLQQAEKRTSEHPGTYSMCVDIDDLKQLCGGEDG